MRSIFSKFEAISQASISNCDVTLRGSTASPRCEVCLSGTESSTRPKLLPNLPEHLKALAIFAHNTGWRMRSEIQRLRLDQVDLTVGTVRLEVRTTENMDGRLIYLTAELYALLSGLWQQRQTTLSQCSFVFTYRGAGFNSYKRSLVRAC